MIAAGKLNRRVTIQQPNLSQETTYGSLTDDPTEFASVWASIEPVSARETTTAKSYAETVSHKVTLRYLAEILPTYRIVYGEREFQINGIINPGEANEDTVCYCTEVV